MHNNGFLDYSWPLKQVYHRTRQAVKVLTRRHRVLKELAQFLSTSVNIKPPL